MDLIKNLILNFLIITVIIQNVKFAINIFMQLQIGEKGASVDSGLV